MFNCKSGFTPLDKIFRSCFTVFQHEAVTVSSGMPETEMNSLCLNLVSVLKPPFYLIGESYEKILAYHYRVRPVCERVAGS
jgi:hypothetical protein